MAARLEELTVYELKAVCRAKGLKVSGRKAELIARVAAAPPGVLTDVGTAKPSGKRRGAQGRPRKHTASAPKVPQAEEAAGSGGAGGGSMPGLSLTPVTPEALGAHVAADIDTEVLTRREAEEAEDNERRAQRRAQRRAKLSQYFNEEFNSVVGALELRAGEQYARAFGASPPSETLQPVAAARVLDEATRSTGRRLAWCREYCSASGTGILVDLEERSEWRIHRTALRVDAAVPLACRMLHAGEFVEYEPDAARAFAAAGRATGSEASGWVCGILGWPLMCEASPSSSRPSSW